MSLENSYHDFDTLLLIDWNKASKGDLTVLRIKEALPKKRWSYKRLISWVIRAIRFLRKLCGFTEIMRVSPELDELAWERINEQHGQAFGHDRKHIQYLRLLKRLAMIELEYVITEDRFLLNGIDDVRTELEVFLKQISGDKGGGISETLIALTERTGTLITESNITAKYFFEMVNYYSKKK